MPGCRATPPGTAQQPGIWVVLGLLVGVGLTTACRPPGADRPTRISPRVGDIVLARDSEALRALIPPRTTLSSLLETHGLLAEEAAALVARIRETFDPRRLRAGQAYRIDRYLDGRLREFEYEIDLERRLLVRRDDEAEAPAFTAEVAPIPRTLESITVEGVIDRDAPSLIQAIETAGERIELSLALADVFSGEMDFNSDLQPGDRFRVLVERATRADGAFGGYGPILAAEFDNDGRRLQAVRFAPPDVTPGYYDLEGRSLKRFFLKSPLKFEPRVTSAFSRARRHPILQYTRAHNGVDYSAPAGAPVVAVASGVVKLAGWAGGGGRTVRIRHASGYESEYLHLSSIASGIRAGVRVGQGDLVGRVGATGLATGAHLHYGLRRDGRYVNPVREHQNMPPGEPVSAVHFALFEAARDRMLETLEQGAKAVN